MIQSEAQKLGEWSSWSRIAQNIQQTCLQKSNMGINNMYHSYDMQLTESKKFVLVSADLSD